MCALTSIAHTYATHGTGFLSCVCVEPIKRAARWWLFASDRRRAGVAPAGDEHRSIAFDVANPPVRRDGGCEPAKGHRMTFWRPDGPADRTLSPTSHHPLSLPTRLAFSLHIFNNNKKKTFFFPLLLLPHRTTGEQLYTTLLMYII